MSTPLNPPVSPTPPTPSPTPAPVPRSRAPLYIAVAVVAVVAVLLIAFVVLPTLSSSSSGSGPAVLTYRGAVPIANSAAAGFSGGGWTLLFAAGLDSAVSETEPVNTTALGNVTSACTLTLVAHESSLTLPGFTGNRSLGESPAWEFGYRNGSDAIAIVSVINGHGTVLATLTGAECAFVAQLITPVASNVIDSSQAAAAVEPYATSFLAADPNASAEFALVGGITFLGHSTHAEWSVDYSTCALSSSASGTGDEFNATVNALTGQVEGHNTTSDVSCGSSSTAAVPTPGATGPGPVLGAEVRVRTKGPG